MFNTNVLRLNYSCCFLDQSLASCYDCALCSMSFMSPSDLTSHLRTHSESVTNNISESNLWVWFKPLCSGICIISSVCIGVFIATLRSRASRHCVNTLRIISMMGHTKICAAPLQKATSRVLSRTPVNIATWISIEPKRWSLILENTKLKLQKYQSNARIQNSNAEIVVGNWARNDGLLNTF